MESFKNSTLPAKLEFWCEGVSCCDEKWEAAYLSFETREQEIRKFVRRFEKLGLTKLDRSLSVVDLFCGRGSGLLAMERLGFNNLEGVDLAPNLLIDYQGSAKLYVGDCRHINLENGSRNIVSIQGGLHHLEHIPEDLQAVLLEICRILRPDGYVFIVEPWQTSFLQLIHFLVRQAVIRRLSKKADALQRMIEREQKNYFNWLENSLLITKSFKQMFIVERQEIHLGKLYFVGRPRIETAKMWK
jgi:ubiquinone/menaquinone biosynthesis C-methylase UbiE